VTSDYSDIMTFTTDGCCINPELMFTMDANDNAIIEWQKSSAARQYELRYRLLGETDWNTQVTSEDFLEIENALSCQQYEVQIKIECESGPLDFSDAIILNTNNCGDCQEEDYCQVQDGFVAEVMFIEEVQLNNFSNVSGNNEGYGNFAVFNSADLKLGTTFDLTVTPGFTGNPRNYSVMAWIDYNLDGRFTPNEQIVQETALSGPSHTASVLLPGAADQGITRMRVILTNALDLDACENIMGFRDGEVEDYCLNLFWTSSVEDELSSTQEFFIHPNPFNDILKIDYNSSRQISDAKVEILDMLGKAIFSQNVTLNSNDSSLTLKPHNLSDGMHIVRITNEKGQILHSSKMIYLKE